MDAKEKQPMEATNAVGQDWDTITLARAAGVTATYVRYLLSQGTLQGEKFSRVWRIPYEEGLRWLESRQK